MFSRFRSRNSAITFDVGTAGIRAFQLAARGPQLSGRDSLWLELPPTQRQADDELSPPDYSRIVRLVGQGRFVGADVGLVLSPPDVRFGTLRLPNQALQQPERQVREALAWELAREMRTDAHQLEVRYWRLPSGHQQGLNVMAVALPTARALAWHDLFMRDHLNLRRIEIAPCALVHLASRIWSPAEDELWGILDLGFRRTTLTAVLGQVPVYIRSLPTSSDSWTRRLAEAFEVAHAGAEQIKRTHGIRPAERGVRPGQPDRPLANAQDIPSVVFGLLREPLDDLVREIGKCFAYVMQNFSDADASRLVLAGGGANLGGLVEYFELQLGLSVGLLASPAGPAAALCSEPPPRENLLPDTTIRPELAAAVGGALLDLETS